MHQITLADIRKMARESKEALWQAADSVSRLPRIFLHWSAGHYGQPFHEYHINIDQNGQVYTDALNFAEVLAHTWRQNTGSIGVSLLCCAGADTNNLGSEPPTNLQIEAMAQVVAALCQELDFPCDFDHIRTHAEQADLDGYGPASTCERWDLWFLPGTEKGEGGNLIRGKATWYMQNWAGIT